MKFLSSMKAKTFALLALALSTVVGSAHAELPAAVATAFTDLLADIMSLIDLAWTVAVPVTIAFIIIGMFKRAAYSAT